MFLSFLYLSNTMQWSYQTHQNDLPSLKSNKTQLGTMTWNFLKCTSKPYLNPSVNKNRNGGTWEQVNQRGDGGRNENRKYPRLSECSSTVILTWGGGHCGWRTGAGGSGGYRLPALAHPALPISCLLTEKMSSFTSLQLKTLLSQPRRRLRRSDRPEHFIPSTISHFLPDSSRWL